VLGAFSTVFAKVVSAIDSNGRTIWIADAHRDNRKAFGCAGGGKANCAYGIGIGDSRFEALAPQLCRSCSNQGVRKTFPVNGSFTSVPGRKLVDIDIT
jgi:hypothetical protein